MFFFLVCFYVVFLCFFVVVFLCVFVRFVGFRVFWRVFFLYFWVCFWCCGCACFGLFCFPEHKHDFFLVVVILIMTPLVIAFFGVFVIVAVLNFIVIVSLLS